MEKIKVSVICTTYNHEAYLQTALQSIIEQKTNFKYEVLIGDDCSTDKSRSIIMKYEQMYPSIIKAFYHNKNVGARENVDFLCSKAQGIYMIFLETDDFWIDKNKLQKQADFLDTHPDFIEIAHQCVMVDKNNKPIGVKYPECTNREYKLKHFRKGLFPGQTASRMFRNYYKYPVNFSTRIVTSKEFDGPGDIRRAFMNVSNSRVGCLPYVMSAYRFVLNGGSSYTANRKKDPLINLKYKQYLVNYAKKDVKTKESVFSAEYMFVREMTMALLKKNISINEFTVYFKSIEYKRVLFKVILYLFSTMIKKPFGLNKTYLKYDCSADNLLLNNYFKSINS